MVTRTVISPNCSAIVCLNQIAVRRMRTDCLSCYKIKSTKKRVRVSVPVRGGQAKNIPIHRESMSSISSIKSISVLIDRDRWLNLFRVDSSFISKEAFYGLPKNGLPPASKNKRRCLNCPRQKLHDACQPGILYRQELKPVGRCCYRLLDEPGR